MRRTHKPRKIKKGAWFIRIRGSYLPVSGAGWLTYIPFTAYLLGTLYIGWHDASNRALAVLFVVPNWVAAAVVMTWLAARKS
jgi:hypothetical protein